MLLQDGTAAVAILSGPAHILRLLDAAPAHTWTSSERARSLQRAATSRPSVQTTEMQY